MPGLPGEPVLGPPAEPGSRSPARELSSRLAASIVFLTSAAVLVLEILAGRLLAPYVGVSLETYTGIIGTVLGGIAVGTWWGGRMADRVDPRRTLGPLLVVGGALALFAVPAVSTFGAAGLGTGPVAIVILASIGFFAPAAVLSAVSPTVVKLQLSHLAETGSVVGRLSALGTAGAIAGTFITGFVLVAALPSRPVVLAIGGSLVAGGLALWARLARPQGAPPPVGGVLLALTAAATTALLPVPCQVESAYFCARVVADPDRPTGRTLFLDTLRHSYVDLADPAYLEFSYAQVVGDVVDATWPEDRPLRALHVGGGGFSLPRYLRATRPGSYSRVLELDATLPLIGEQQLGLVTGPDLEVVIGDARLTLKGEPDGTYDLVVGDAFGGRAVPWHLTTVEFLEDVRRTLTPDGLYVMNLIDYPPLGFARAEVATLRGVFRHVALIAPRAQAAGEAGGNFVLVASDAPLDVDGIAAQNARRGGGDAILSTEAELDGFVGGATILTDDFAPVDQLISPAS